MFKIWSQINNDAKTELKPDFGMRTWNDLTENDKYIIWKNIEWYFFNKNKKIERGEYGGTTGYYEFFGQNTDTKNTKQGLIMCTILELNNKYKAKNYAPNSLDEFNLGTSCFDFANIFMKQQENVVFELITLYCKELLLIRAEKEPYQNKDEDDINYKKRTTEWRFEEFDNFAKRLNEVFNDFGLNVVLSRQGFIPKQEEKITEQIIIPTLKALSGNKWQKVNEHLEEAFNAYKKKDYSASITNTVSGIQAFLQILVIGKVGKGDISKLIEQAIKTKIISDDSFTRLILKNIESVFAKERQTKGIAHPKITNPSENNARLIINLAMVFIQHCIQEKE